LDPAHIHPCPPFYESPQTQSPRLASLTSLIPLHGHVSAIHASGFFHLFNEEKQLQVARTLASLMSPLPGSIILGQHVALPEKGIGTELLGAKGHMFCHSPQSWEEMWDGQVFKKGSVVVKAHLVHIEAANTDVMFWSVTRV
jgi:hypothetical protein